MKTTVSLALMVTLARPALGVAQERPADHPDHEELRAMLRTVKQAVNENKLDMLSPLVDKDFSITMLDQALIIEPRQLKEYFYRHFEAPGSILRSIHIEPEADILTLFLHDRMGVNRGSSTDTYTLKSGGQVVLKTRWSATVRKADDDRWKIVSLHVGANVLDNPILGFAQRAGQMWGAGGLLVGLLLGFLGGRWRRRPAPERSSA